MGLLERLNLSLVVTVIGVAGLEIIVAQAPKTISVLSYRLIFWSVSLFFVCSFFSLLAVISQQSGVSRTTPAGQVPGMLLRGVWSFLTFMLVGLILLFIGLAHISLSVIV